MHSFAQLFIILHKYALYCAKKEQKIILIMQHIAKLCKRIQNYAK